MAVITIIGIFAALAAPGISATFKDRKTGGVANDVAAIFRLARSRALHARGQCGHVPGTGGAGARGGARCNLSGGSIGMHARMWEHPGIGRYIRELAVKLVPAAKAKRFALLASPKFQEAFGPAPIGRAHV